MILVECDICGRRELRGYRSVHVDNAPCGIELAWSCRGCGCPHVELTGRAGPRPVPSSATAA
ncbi:MAG: hypothetical protein ACRD0U_09150 [Acidimicrobiales bacterium]